MKKVILLEPVLAHYRKDLYEYYLNCPDIDFTIVGGTDYQGIRSLEDERFVTLKYNSFLLFYHRFYYLKGAMKFVLSHRPAIVICSGIDFHHYYSLMMFLLYRIILRNEFYWWSHGTFGNQGRFGRWARKLFYKPASGIFTYSRKGKENLLLMGIKEDKIKVIGNALNYLDYGYLSRDIHELSLPNKVFTILFSGRINSEKRLDILIRALGILKAKNLFPFKCYIAGDGDTCSLKKLSIDQNLADIVDFTGSKYGTDISSYFLESDIFVYPGGIGLALLHALSYGLPVITTDNFALQMPEIELLIPGKNGDLYRDASPGDLAEKIVMWKERIDGSKDEIVKNCIDVIDKLGYKPDKMGRTVINYLEEKHNLQD